jgi:type I restriction enzyme S subunit
MEHIEKKKMVAPELRFKGFDEEWKSNTLLGFDLKVIDGDRGTNYPNGDDFSSKGYCLFMSAKNVTKTGFSFEEKVFITKEKDELLRNGKLKRNDLVLTTRGSVGNIAFYNSKIGLDNLRINSGMVLIRNENKNLAPDFIYSSFFSPRIDRQLKTIVFGSAQPQLTIKEINKFKFIIPTLPEQQKIASFLSSVDEKIQQLTRKKQLLEQYKKGVMQQLFSGKLRFKDEDGKDFPEWEERFYGDIYSFYSTNSFSRDNLNYENGGIKNIHYGDIHTKFTTLFDVTREIVPFLNDDIDISKIKEENFCKNGDLVIADASEDYADIGKSIELVNLNNEKVVAGLHTFLARPNKITMHLGFSGHLVKASYVRKQIMTIAQGTKVLSLSTGRLGKVKLKIPVIEEQKKIAEYLSNIDNKIESVNNQITQTQTFKKGLLQQMFV